MTATKPQGLSAKPAGAAAAAIALGMALALIKPWEGRSLVAYQDIVGVWTVCEGVTGKAAIPGRRYSSQECDAITKTELGRHYKGVAACINRPVQPHEMAAIVSWTYNVGIGAACKSTLIKLLNSGAPATIWCGELMKWNRAGGVPIKGLTNRRKAEMNVCLGGEIGAF